MNPDPDHQSESSEEDEFSQPPMTFRVEQTSQDEPKLIWAAGHADYLPQTSGRIYPGNPFHPIGSTVLCGLCHYRRKAFYCAECINKGEFVHSNLCRPEDLSEKRLKETALQRKSDKLKNDILEKTKVSQKILLLNEQIKFVRQRIKYFHLAIDRHSQDLQKIQAKKSNLTKVNVKRRHRLPLFPGKVEQMRNTAKNRQQDVEKARISTNLKLQELALARQQYAQELTKHIFQIVPDQAPELPSRDQGLFELGQSHDRDLTQDMLDAMEGFGTGQADHASERQWESSDTITSQSVDENITHSVLLESQSGLCSSEIEDELFEAMGTSFIRGRWVSSKRLDSKDLQFYRIVSAIVASTDENPVFPVLNDRNLDTERAIHQTTSAALTFCTQLVTLLSSCFDTIMPKRVTLMDFGITSSKSEYRFYKLISKLNLNVLHLCLAHGVDPELLRPRQFVNNMFHLFEHLKRDDLTYLGQSYKALPHAETLYKMSEELSSDVARLAEDFANPDSEDESEGDELRDWEAVSSVTPGFMSQLSGGDSFPILHTASISNLSQQSGITSASTLMSSLFRGFTGGGNAS